MDALADRFDAAAAALTDAHRALSAIEAADTAFGADQPGVPGRLGRALHERWVAVLTARAHEADAAAGRITDLGQALRTTAERYAETDDLAGRRLRREI